MSSIRHDNKTKAYCIEQVVGGKTCAEVSRETGIPANTVNEWVSRYWFGSQTKGVTVKESKV